MTYVRQNILNLSDADLGKLRDGFRGMYEYPVTDTRGFLFWAARHGFPSYECPHNSPHFLTWHRVYLLALERVLQDVLGDYEFGLPYWDWTAARTLTEGVPAVLSDAQLADGTPNPLHHAHILVGDVDRDTARGPADPGHAWLTEAQRGASEARDEARFHHAFLSSHQRSLENGHNAFHGWISGDMGDPSWAAYDPLFWFHHANVDRLWAAWQDDHPDAVYPDEILDWTLRPFSLRGRDVLNYRAFEYEYASSAPVVDAPPHDDGLQSADSIHCELNAPNAGYRNAILLLHAVQYPKGTMEVRCFINKKDANGLTALDANDHFAGRRIIFSARECLGKDGGHCDWKKPRGPLDPRGPHHRLPFQLAIDVTEAVRKTTAAGNDKLDVSLVLVDDQGDPIPATGLTFSHMQLISRD